MTLEEKKRQLEKWEREVEYFEFYTLSKKYGFWYPGKEEQDE
jgi:hypothetical protein